MCDLVTCLRERAAKAREEGATTTLIDGLLLEEAAAEIEALKAENASLKTKLEELDFLRHERWPQSVSAMGAALMTARVAFRYIDDAERGIRNESSWMVTRIIDDQRDTVRSALSQLRAALEKGE